MHHIATRHSLVCVRNPSQEFAVPTEEYENDEHHMPEQMDSQLSFILAVHSHCPLPELWDRIPGKKVCISLPCCGDCGTLESAPFLRDDDPEVLSPRRTFLCWTNMPVLQDAVAQVKKEFNL